MSCVFFQNFKFFAISIKLIHLIANANAVIIAIAMMMAVFVVSSSLFFMLAIIAIVIAAKINIEYSFMFSKLQKLRYI